MDDDSLCDSLGIDVIEPWTLAPGDLVADVAAQALAGHTWELVAHIPGIRWAFASKTGGLIVSDRPELEQALLLHHRLDADGISLKACHACLSNDTSWKDNNLTK